MWYFAWLLGLPLAIVFAVADALWLEMRSDAALWEQDAPSAKQAKQGSQ